MTKKDLLKEVARLESLNDHLSTELTYVDHLMRLVGFKNGIDTVKATAIELVEIESENAEEQ